MWEETWDPGGWRPQIHRRERWGLPRGLCSVTRLRVDHVGTEQAAPAGAPGELAAIPALLFVSLTL